MSHAMTEAFKTIEGTPTQRLVGYMLADAYNDKTGRCDLSIASLVKLTSLCERAVQKSILELERRGNLTRIFRQGTSTQYNLHPRTICTPAPSAPPNVIHHPPAPHAPPPPHLMHPTPASGAPKPEGTVIITVSEPEKKRTSKKLKKSKMTDEEWMESLKTDPNNQGINVDMEYSKACAWCVKNNTSLSRRRFENWLDRASKDKPISIVAKQPMPSVTGGIQLGPVNGRWVSVC